MSISTSPPRIQSARGWRRKNEDFGHLHLTKTSFGGWPDLRIPARLDPRSWLTTYESKGLRSSCGDALATCLELTHWLKSGGEVVRLSRMFSYLISQKMDGLIGSDVGATVAGSVKAAKVFGVCRERVMRTRNRYSDGLALAAIADAETYRAVSHSMLRSYKKVQQYLGHGLGGVLLATTWRASLGCAAGRIDEITGPALGGHVLAIVGYTDELADEKGRPYLIAADSGNSDWGINGFGLIAPRLFDKWGSDRTSLLVGLSDLHNYRQRAFPAT